MMELNYIKGKHGCRKTRCETAVRDDDVSDSHQGGCSVASKKSLNPGYAAKVEPWIHLSTHETREKQESMMA